MQWRSSLTQCERTSIEGERFGANFGVLAKGCWLHNNDIYIYTEIYIYKKRNRSFWFYRYWTESVKCHTCLITASNTLLYVFFKGGTLAGSYSSELDKYWRKCHDETTSADTAGQRQHAGTDEFCKYNVLRYILFIYGRWFVMDWLLNRECSFSKKIVILMFCFFGSTFLCTFSLYIFFLRLDFLSISFARIGSFCCCVSDAGLCTQTHVPSKLFRSRILARCRNLVTEDCTVH